MIKMTKIKLGEVVNFYDGYPFSKLEQQDKGDFNYIKITNFSSGEIILDQNKINKPVKYREENILNGNEIIVAMSGSTGKAAFNTYKNVLVNQRIAILRAKEDIVNPKYLRHLLVNSNFESYCNNLGTGLQKNISKETIANYEFNLPSLKVQNEIVEVLDKFTVLEAELEAELEARTKQYEYYRESLINKKDVELITIGEIANLVRGASPRPIASYITTENKNSLPWIKISDTKLGEKYLKETKERVTIPGSLKSRIINP